jgi:hypothetical protein
MSPKLLLLELPLVHNGADLFGLGWMKNMIILSCFLLLEQVAISIPEESHCNNCMQFVVVVVISKKEKW